MAARVDLPAATAAARRPAEERPAAETADIPAVAIQAEETLVVIPAAEVPAAAAEDIPVVAAELQVAAVDILAAVEAPVEAADTATSH